MDYVSQPGGQVWLADAPNWLNKPNVDCCKMAISPASVKLLMGRGQSVLLGQLYGIVATGLIKTQIIFEGLKRDMLCGNDNNAAKGKLAFTWAAHRDAYLTGDRFAPTLAFRDPPPNRIFCVIGSPNQAAAQFPGVDGWIEHWSWVAADQKRPGAPIDWESRYDSEKWQAAA